MTVENKINNSWFVKLYNRTWVLDILIISFDSSAGLMEAWHSFFIHLLLLSGLDAEDGLVWTEEGAEEPALEVDQAPSQDDGIIDY